ncbi:cardiolipin synthase [Desulfonatronovibrio magnus]|uniref:cardiolipin synthase n=1 Tax=Desulfonatronovibrio magnus TaxID=698827 RepID=UPI0005EBADA2|nr:cardiolipin synthase [Desulfonatronovibrio magnus]
MALFIFFLIMLLNVWAAGHALMYKRDPRTAWGWIVTCLLIPTLGPILYYLLGINRIKTRAKKLKAEPLALTQQGRGAPQSTLTSRVLVQDVDKFHSNLRAGLTDKLTNRPLLGGNKVHVLFNGNQAFPEMLAAINSARKYVYLQTFIFESNNWGMRFVGALSQACKRGLDVRVLVDGIGELYSWPKISRYLKRAGVPFSRFLPPKLIPVSPFLNLRNHRKMLIIDDMMGFTGGMNIGDRHVVDYEKSKGAQDIQFQFKGPVVSQMKDVFMEDWSFCKGFHLPTRDSGHDLQVFGDAFCRTITVGPNQDIDKLRMLYTGMVSQAKSKIIIMTPYFLPSQELLGALQVASLRGVEVTIVLPEKNNLPFVHWATRNMLWEILQYRVNVYYQPPPFDHSKLFLVDDEYCVIGSANMDPRSLRLNFEMVVEVYSKRLAAILYSHVEQKIMSSRKLTLEEVDSRSIPARLRDSLCWLFSPYL